MPQHESTASSLISSYLRRFFEPLLDQAMNLPVGEWLKSQPRWVKILLEPVIYYGGHVADQKIPDGASTLGHAFREFIRDIPSEVGVRMFKGSETHPELPSSFRQKIMDLNPETRSKLAGEFEKLPVQRQEQVWRFIQRSNIEMIASFFEHDEETRQRLLTMLNFKDTPEFREFVERGYRKFSDGVGSVVREAKKVVISYGSLVKRVVTGGLLFGLLSLLIIATGHSLGSIGIIGGGLVLGFGVLMAILAVAFVILVLIQAVADNFEAFRKVTEQYYTTIVAGIVIIFFLIITEGPLINWRLSMALVAAGLLFVVHQILPGRNGNASPYIFRINLWVVAFGILLALQSLYYHLPSQLRDPIWRIGFAATGQYPNQIPYRLEDLKLRRGPVFPLYNPADGKSQRWIDQSSPDLDDLIFDAPCFSPRTGLPCITLTDEILRKVIISLEKKVQTSKPPEQIINIHQYPEQPVKPEPEIPIESPQPESPPPVPPQPEKIKTISINKPVSFYVSLDQPLSMATDILGKIVSAHPVYEPMLVKLGFDENTRVGLRIIAVQKRTQSSPAAITLKPSVIWHNNTEYLIESNAISIRVEPREKSQTRPNHPLFLPPAVPSSGPMIDRIFGRNRDKIITENEDQLEIPSGYEISITVTRIIPAAN